jgi:hypothetical protein
MLKLYFFYDSWPYVRKKNFFIGLTQKTLFDHKPTQKSWSGLKTIQKQNQSQKTD